MEKVAVELLVPKESKEVVDVLASILMDVKAKKSVAEMAAGNLTKLFTAVEGFDKISEEIKGDGQDEVAAYLVQQILAALKSA